MIMDAAKMRVVTRDEKHRNIINVSYDDVYYDYENAGSSLSDFDKVIEVTVHTEELRNVVEGVIDLLLEEKHA